MPCARLPLASAPDVAAPRDERQGYNDGKDGREASAEAGPMEVDGWEVATRHMMAVSISRSGCSWWENSGARDRASAMKWVFPGTQLTSKEYLATFSRMRCNLGLARANKSF